MPQIPIARPKLPAAERIVPYLKEIDATRYYSNFGPLVSSFEDRIVAMFPAFRLKAAATQLARVQVSDTVSITNKTKLQNEPTG